MMEVSAPGRRRGSRNYTQEFREMVVAQANDPARSIADVAQEHGLNGLCQLVEAEEKRRRERASSEDVGRILGDFGDVAPRNESRRELFAIE
ncbi:transposase [Paraburkholderia sediminicola]|uniref:transposase n=1 Tax=Paraburkholderia sediminicola TaxID=458836 RepID=UPI0038BD658A